MDQEELWWSAHGEQRGCQRRTRAATVDSKLSVKCECKRERNGGREATEHFKPVKKGWGRHARALAMTAARWRPGRAHTEAGRRGARGRRPEERS
jgi:hypothetical protein